MTEERVKKTCFWKQRLKRHFPILTWMAAYRKSDLVADTIAGLTLGLTLVPQSVAYAALAGVSAEHGLYSSFVGGFVYFFFGTVKEVSVGPTSLISLLTFEFTKNLPIEFVFLFTFLCGFIEFFCGLLHFGFLVNFISVPVITSFQSATSIIIVASQLKDIFGVPKFKPGNFLNNVWSVAERLPQANWGDIVLSLCCCSFLLLLRQLKNLKITKAKNLTAKNREIIETTTWFVSISRNALCVFISCLVAYAFVKRGDEPPFKLTGDVPSRWPTFNFPTFSGRFENRTLTFGEVIYEMSPGLAVVPLISILANVAIAKSFGSGATVDATQEMLTLGMCNMIGSMFGSLPTCGAFTRSVVSNASGVRSPLAGLFTGTIIILVIKYLTPYFYFIPKPALASILTCAAIFMIDFKTIWLVWKGNKLDFICVFATFVASLLLGVQIGLGLGILISLSCLLYMWARPSVAIEMKETGTGSYYLVRPDVGFFFPSNDFIRSQIINRCSRDIPIALDCSRFKGVDYTCARGINDLASYFHSKNRNFVLFNLSQEIYSGLKKSKVQLDLKPSACGSEEDELKAILFESKATETFFAILSDTVNSKELKTLESDFEEKALVQNANE